MNTLEMSKYEISNTCQCRHCEQCGIGTESWTCDDCGEDTREMSYCGGECFEYKREWFAEDIERFTKNHSHVRIDGQRMGWQSRSGYLIVEADDRAIFDALTFSGDWTLHVECDGQSMKIRRTSHDEPMGATFTLTPVDSDERESEDE